LSIGCGGAVEAQGAQVDIRFQGGFPSELREAASGHSPIELHLPEAILGCAIALGEEEVIAILGIDVEDTPTVADDLDRGMDPLQVHAAMDEGLDAGEDATQQTYEDKGENNQEGDGHLKQSGNDAHIRPPAVRIHRVIVAHRGGQRQVMRRGGIYTPGANAL
jgi:hypothetical protein